MSRFGVGNPGVALGASNPYSREALLRGGVMVTHEAHNLGILVQVQTPQHDMDTTTPPAASAAGGVVPSRLPFIDVVRGIAVLLVVATHMFLFAYGSFHLPTRNRLVQFGEADSFFDIVNYFVRLGGWIGVSAFFAVSGFCIHYGFLRGTEGYNFFSFIIRRVARIFPAFLVSLLVTVAFGLLFEYKTVSSAFDFLSYASLTFNYFSILQPEFNPAYWTLPIEFQLYLLYPFVLLLRKRINFGKLILLLSIPQILYYCIRLYGAYELKWKFEILGPWESSPFGYWFAWLIGAFVAERFIAGKRAFPNWALPVMLGLFSLTIFWHPAVAARYTIGACMCAVVLDRCIRSYRAGYIGRGLMWLGKISYSIYLIHMPFFALIVATLFPDVEDMEDLAMVTLFALFFMCVVPLSWLMYQHVERVGIRYGKKLASRVDTVA